MTLLILHPAEHVRPCSRHRCDAVLASDARVLSSKPCHVCGSFSHKIIPAFSHHTDELRLVKYWPTLVETALRHGSLRKEDLRDSMGEENRPTDWFNTANDTPRTTPSRRRRRPHTMQLVDTRRAGPGNGEPCTYLQIVS